MTSEVVLGRGLLHGDLRLRKSLLVSSKRHSTPDSAKQTFKLEVTVRYSVKSLFVINLHLNKIPAGMPLGFEREKIP